MGKLYFTRVKTQDADGNEEETLCFTKSPLLPKGSKKSQAKLSIKVKQEKPKNK